MVILPVRQPIKASFVASQGLPSIKGCPYSLFLGLIIKKSARYSQVSTETITSSDVPSGLMTERSASSSKVVIGSKAMMPRILKIVVVRMLMDSPKLTKALGKERLFI